MSDKKDNYGFEVFCREHERRIKSAVNYTGDKKADMKLIKTSIYLIFLSMAVISIVVFSIIMTFFSGSELWSKILLYGVCTDIVIMAIAFKVRKLIIKSFTQ
jgi:hypothetical protein